MKTLKPRPLTDRFIEDLRLKMKGLKIKKTELASRLGTSKQHVHYWFKRTKNPCSESILKIQELLKTSFRMFL